MTNMTHFAPLLGQASSSGGGLGFFLPMILIMVAMYFFMIAPQRKKDKEHKKMLSELKTGDKVITIGGIFGTITAVKDDRYHLKVDDSTRIEILRTAIQGRQPDSNAESK